MNLDSYPYLEVYLQALHQAEQNLLLLLGIVGGVLLIYCAAVYLKRQREAVLALTAFFWLTFILAVFTGG